jgi:hypothetical protein
VDASQTVELTYDQLLELFREQQTWTLTEIAKALRNIGATDQGIGGGSIVGPTDSNARVGVRKNSGVTTYLRRRLNLIEGAGVSLTVADDATDEEVDVTVAATGGGLGSYVLVASQNGCALDTNLTSGGGTDDTAALQAILNVANTGGRVLLILDGPALVSGLDVYGNTTILVLEGGGLFLKANSNRAILRNVNRSRGAVTDEHITILGGLYNGNRANQTGAGVTGRQEADNTFMSGMQFFGVNYLTLKDLEVVNTLAFGVNVGNGSHLVVDGYRFDWGGVGTPHTSTNQDGFHLNGPLTHSYLANLRIQSNDDALAINAGDDTCVDLTNPAEPNYNIHGPYVGQGDITDLIVDGLVFDACLSGIRLLSHDANSRIDRVEIRNVTGTVVDQAVLVSSGGAGDGSFGRVVIDGFDVLMDASTGSGEPSLMQLDATFEQLVLRNVEIHNPADARPLIWLRPTASYNSVEIDGLGIYDSTSGTTGLIAVKLDGYVKRLRGSRWNWVRLGVPGYASSFLALGNAASRIDALNLNGVQSNLVNYVVSHTAGTLTYVQAANVRHESSNGNPTIYTSGTITQLDLSNWYGTATHLGTVTTTKGDAFDTTNPSGMTNPMTTAGDMIITGITEIADTGNDLGNVATGAAGASATAGSALLGTTPSQMLDGNWATTFVANGSGTDAWAKVDLGQGRWVWKLYYNDASDSDSSYGVDGFKVYASLDDASYTLVKQGASRTHTQTLTLGNPTFGRYWKLVSDGDDDNKWGIRTLEIHAYGPTTGPAGAVRLPIGDANDVLTVESGVPTWKPPTGGSLADHDHTGDAGDGGQLTVAALSSGTATTGQVPKADGSGGVAWGDDATSAGGGMENPMTTAGDLIVGGASGTPTRLAKGTDGKVLKVVDGVLTWADDATSAGSGDVATDALWDAKGDLAVGTGANAASRLAVGSNGQVPIADSAKATGLRWGNFPGGDYAREGTPTTIPGCRIWIAADKLSGYADNDSVFSVENLAGFGEQIAVNDNANMKYRTNIVNSLPVFRLSGAAHFRLSNAPVNCVTFTFFVVCKFSALTNAYSGVVGYNLFADGGGLFVKSNGKSAEYYGSNSYDGTGAATYDTTNWNLIADVHIPYQWTVRRNLALDKTTNLGSYVNNPASCYLGNQFVASRNMAGDIAEAIFYSRALSSSEIDAVEGYLAAKYGL